MLTPDQVAALEAPPADDPVPTDVRPAVEVAVVVTAADGRTWDLGTPGTDEFARRLAAYREDRGQDR